MARRPVPFPRVGLYYPIALSSGKRYVFHPTKYLESRGAGTYNHRKNLIALNMMDTKPVIYELSEIKQEEI